MNLRFVEAFFWAATLKSVTRAAEKLYKRDGRQQHSTCVLTDEQREGLLDVDE